MITKTLDGKEYRIDDNLTALDALTHQETVKDCDKLTDSIGAAFLVCLRDPDGARYADATAALKSVSARHTLALFDECLKALGLGEQDLPLLPSNDSPSD